MSKLTSLIRRAPKRLSAAVLVIAAAIIVPAIVSAWGPDRATYTYEKPAPHVTFNSITNNPNIGDERNFVRIRQDGVGTYSDNTNLEPGKVYQVMVYYHNNATSTLNASGKGIAKDVKLRMELPGVVSPGVNAVLAGNISSSNATPGTVWDEAYGKNATSGEIALRYVSGSAKVTSNGKVNGATLPDSLFSTGTALGYDSLNGTLPGCNEYAGYVTFKFRVDKPNFTIKKEVSTDGKTWVKNTSAKAGSTVHYRMVFHNTGTTQLDKVSLHDKLPTGVSYVPGSSLIANETTGGSYKKASDGITTNGYNVGAYKPNGNVYFKIQAKLPNSDAMKCGTNTYVNNIRATTSGGYKEDTATVTVEKDCPKPKNPAVSIDKKVDGVELKQVEVGKEFTYQIVVRNTGDVDLKDVVVSDPAPANVQFVSTDKGTITDNKLSYTVSELKVGASLTINLKAKVTKDVAGTITNTACVETPTVPGGNPDDCDPAKVIVPNQPAVSIDKKVDGVDHKKVAIGQVYTYQIVVRNVGNSDLKDVVVSDPAPKNVQFISSDKGTLKDNKWTATIADLKVGQSVAYAIKAKVTAQTDGNIVNTACVDAPQVPGNPDDCDPATVVVPPVPVTPVTPPELPQTGAGDGIVALIGLGALVASVGYYVASRRALA